MSKAFLAGPDADSDVGDLARKIIAAQTKEIATMHGMEGKKPKGMGLLIGIGPKPELDGESDMGEESMDPDDEGKRMAGAALRRALQGDDDMAVYDAMRSCMEFLMDEDDGKVSEEPPPDDMDMPAMAEA